MTKEDFRLVNSPVWSPDGNYIAVRKHFTKHRSLGTGEIWLYHVSGGKGVPMTEKVNDQKDVGEPAFSPDGAFVYYSLDNTPGATFEYNKDPYNEIYAIKRLERATGRIETVAGGAGGAARPTPSPDGKSLAFIRRIGGTGHGATLRAVAKDAVEADRRCVQAHCAHTHAPARRAASTTGRKNTFRPRRQSARSATRWVTSTPA